MFELRYVRVCLLLSSQSSQVEGQLLTLQDVTVTSTGLAGSGRDSSVQLTGGELRVQGGLNVGSALSGGQLTLNLLGALDFLLIVLLLTQRVTVVVLVPLTEGSGIDLNNSGLGQGVGSNQLIVRRVVCNNCKSGLSGNTLGSPREVTGLNSQSSELLVATSGSDTVDTLGADLGVGGLST